MKFVSYHTSGASTFGAVRGDGVVDVGARLPEIPDLGALLAHDRVDDARSIAEHHDPDLPLDAIVFEPTIPRPGKIICVGVNYGGRNAEYRDGSAEAERPSLFPRFPSSLVGHEQPLLRPPESAQLDYEGEIVAVMGKGGRRIPADLALDHLVGLTLGNEGTIRDWVRHAKFNVTQGKNWDASGAMGPWMVTMDEIGPLDQLRLTTHVNGELRQDDTPATMRFPVAELIHYISTFTTLAPGDVIFTGTPTGAGARFDPPRYLVPGDVVEVHVDAIGTLRNPVQDETP